MMTKATIRFKCDKCNSDFDPSHGGICRICKRLLCSKHLLGFWRINLKLDNKQPICPECIKKERNKKQRVVDMEN